MRTLALLAIRFYQRYLSPHKGFCCAYGAYTGHASCSALGYRAVRRFGVWHGVQVLDSRMAKCGVAYRRYRATPLNRQTGECDLPCDVSGCDGGGGSSKSGSCFEIGDCFDIGDCCDWRKRKRDVRNDQRTHVPPRRNRRNEPYR